MAIATALVVGGTGPTGPHVVNGLLARGYDVAIFHSGQHEVPLPPIEHIHGDPHFLETIADALQERQFDVVVAQYGRLRHVARHFRGRTNHLVAIGGATGFNAPPQDPRWGALGRPAIQGEDRIVLEDDVGRNKFGYRMAEAYSSLFEMSEQGAFAATYIGYPLLYGPGQLGPREWSIVKRALDGRQRFLLPDGGLKLETRGFVENVAQAPLLALDHRDISAGKAYVAADREVYSIRSWAHRIVQYLGAEMEFIDAPFWYAKPAHPLLENDREHRLREAEKIRCELGYQDTVPPDAALDATVEWLLRNPPEPGGESERQLGDPFDYEAEDRLIAAWLDWSSQLPEAIYDVPEYAHMYRHPRTTNEPWQRPNSPRRP